MRIRAYSVGDNQTELEADALRQAHEFFGAAVPLEVEPAYEVRPTIAAERGRWWSEIWVHPEPQPVTQSDPAEAARRQVQQVLRYIRDRYGAGRAG